MTVLDEVNFALKTATSPEALARVLKDAWNHHLVAENEKRGSWRPKNVYASQSHPCVRNMALNMIDPEARPPLEANSLNRMLFGREVEDFVLRELNIAGKYSTPKFQVVGQQERIEIRDRNGRVVITGKKDFGVKFDGIQRVCPGEIKFGDAVVRIEELGDFEHGRWTRSMPKQLMSYMFGTGEPLGFLILPKLKGFHPIPVLLEDHLDKMEEFLTDATTAVDAKEAWEAAVESGASEEDKQSVLPPFIDDKSECASCDHFNRSCFPDTDYGEGIQVLPESVGVDLDIMARTKEAHREYEKAERNVSPKLKGIPQALAGEFIITGKWQRGSMPCPDKTHRVKVEEYSWRKKFDRLVGPSVEEKEE